MCLPVESPCERDIFVYHLFNFGPSESVILVGGTVAVLGSHVRVERWRHTACSHGCSDRVQELSRGHWELFGGQWGGLF